MSSRVNPYSFSTSLNVMAPSRLPTTSATGMRVPLLTGLAWQIFGAMTIRSFMGFRLTLAVDLTSTRFHFFAVPSPRFSVALTHCCQSATSSHELHADQRKRGVRPAHGAKRAFHQSWRGRPRGAASDGERRNELSEPAAVDLRTNRRNLRPESR